MAEDPLTAVKTALTDAYTKRKKRLVDGSGDFPLWKATDEVKDVTKANGAAGDLIGPEIADAKNPQNMVPAFRKGNTLLALARDRDQNSRDRIVRGGEYIKMMERELVTGLASRMPK